MARRRRRKIWEENEEPWDGPDPDERPSQPTLDLHGLSVDGALRRTRSELARCRAGGARKLVLVTGKGYGSHGGRARILPEIERWLRGEEAQGLGAQGIRRLPHGGALEVSITRSGSGR